MIPTILSQKLRAARFGLRKGWRKASLGKFKIAKQYPYNSKWQQGRYRERRRSEPQ